MLTVEPTETIVALSKLLSENRIGVAVVSREGKAIEGVISERDIAYGLATHGAALLDLPVSDLMTANVITCSPSEPVARVASTMLSRNVRHLPVEDNGHLVGVVSIRDVLKERVNELQQMTALLRRYSKETDRQPEDRE